MLLTQISSAVDVSTTPMMRADAAKALIAVPMGIVMTTSMAAMTKGMSKTPASRADLLASFLEKLLPETARTMMLSAIDGAIALAPELEPRSAALRQAADGIAALLAEAAADTVQGEAQATLARITTPLQALMAPIMEAALLLDPTLAKPKG